MNPQQDKGLDDFLEDLPNAWCEDCEHPRCIGKKASAKDFIENRERHIRRSENQYWVDYYSAEIKAQNGWEDPLAVNRAKLARNNHQQRLAALQNKSEDSHDN